MTTASATAERPLAGRYLRVLGRVMITPSVTVLFVWMIVPLAITLWFSLIDYRLLAPGDKHFVGLANYQALLSNPAFGAAILNTIILISAVLATTIVGGVLLALLLEAASFGRGVLRILVISPFFVMPTVSALLWKNLLMQPQAGLFAWLAKLFGLAALDWFGRAPLLAISLIVAWQWLPFACLILLTSLQSFNQEQREAALLDGASSFEVFRYLTLPHLARPIAIIVMMETIFLLGVFAEILVTTGGGPGTATTNLAFLVYSQALLQYNIGAASAAGVVAVIFANIVAFFLVRAVGRSLSQ